MPRFPAPLDVLSACSFSNFKSYRKARLPLRPLTLLIGANASGKSNLLEGIRFLSLLAQGRRIDEVWRVTHDSDISIRGARPEALFGPESHRLTIGCELVEQDAEAGDLSLEIFIWLDPYGRLRLSEECLQERRNWLYVGWKNKAPALGIAVYLGNRLREGIPDLMLANDQALFAQLQGTQVPVVSPSNAQERILAATQRLRKVLSSVQFLDPVPSVMRGDSFPADDRLREDGRNVSAVLYNLCQVPEQKQQVLAFIRSLPEQDISDIDFLKGARGDVVVTLEESFGGVGRSYDATQLSDGTLRALAIIAALLSVPPGTLLVIEEIDNGLHPSRAKHLMASIDRLARERGLRVLITTHNPALVDAVPMSAVPDIVLCYRDPKEGDSRLISLDALPDYPALIGQHSVGELMTSGQLEQATKSIAEPATTRQAQASEFVKQLLDRVAQRDAAKSPDEGDE